MIADFVGLLIGAGIGVPLIVQFASGIGNQMTLNTANTISAASLQGQAGSSDAASIAKKQTS